MRNRILAIMMALVFASSMIGCGGKTEAAKEEAPEVVQEAESPEDGQEPQEPEETPEEAQEAGTEASAEAPVSDNPLMNAEIIVNDVMNGTGTTVIGQRATVRISGSEFDALTPEQLYEFATEVVDGSGFNWFTVRADGDIGLQFTGSIIQAVTFGTLDDAGRIMDDQGTWVLRDGTYEFTPASEY